MVLYQTPTSDNSIDLLSKYRSSSTSTVLHQLQTTVAQRRIKYLIALLGVWLFACPSFPTRFDPLRSASNKQRNSRFWSDSSTGTTVQAHLPCRPRTRYRTVLHHLAMDAYFINFRLATRNEELQHYHSSLLLWQKHHTSWIPCLLFNTKEEVSATESQNDTACGARISRLNEIEASFDKVMMTNTTSNQILVAIPVITSLQQHSHSRSRCGSIECTFHYYLSVKSW